MKNPNYFAGAEVAERYRRARPRFHCEAVERIRELNGDRRFQRALDVGCGAGDSTIALATIADEVLGIDVSPEMLELAPPAHNVRYQPGRAEQLDFAAGCFDLVTVALALHWFQPERFFAECRRVLDPAGVLAVYNDHFTTHMQDNAECNRWMRTRFAQRFPQPRRGLRDLDEFQAAACGFRIAQRESFTHLAHFTRTEFIAYLLTRSHTLAPIQQGRQTQLEVEQWLEQELRPMVPDGCTGQFLFKCNLWLLRADGMLPR